MVCYYIWEAFKVVFHIIIFIQIKEAVEMGNSSMVRNFF